MAWLLFFAAALLAEVAGTVGGFGSSVFFVPVAQWLLPMKAVLGVTGAFHVFSNLAKLSLFRHGINWRLALLVGVPSVVLVVAGAYLSNRVAGPAIQQLLGVFLVVFAALLLLRPGLSLPPTATNAVAGGGVAGFLAGLTGTGGAVRGLTLAAFNLEKNAFVATSAAIDMAVDLSRTVVYVQQGYLRREYWPYVAGLVVVAFTGSWLGKQVLGHLSQAVFRRGVLVLLLAIGLLTIWTAFRRG